MPKIVSATPQDEPISLELAKTYLRVDGNDEDDLIMLMIAAVRQDAEMVTWRALATQNITIYLDCWPSGRCIRLPRPPLQSVTSVVYTLEDGTAITWDSSNYEVNTVGPGAIVLKRAASWPSGTLKATNGVAISYTSGYGDPDDIPELLRQAMLYTLGHYFENRESVVVAPGVVASAVPDTAAKIYRQFRAWS